MEAPIEHASFDLEKIKMILKRAFASLEVQCAQFSFGRESMRTAFRRRLSECRQTDLMSVVLRREIPVSGFAGSNAASADLLALFCFVHFARQNAAMIRSTLD